MLPFILHEDYAPNWDFICGGSKLILTCSLNAPNNVNIPSAQLHVLFGSEEASLLHLRTPPKQSRTSDAWHHGIWHVLQGHYLFLNVVSWYQHVRLLTADMLLTSPRQQDRLRSSRPATCICICTHEALRFRGSSALKC
jgi:hypothetical protein